MTPARPELAAHERIAALQRQADLARLARFPAAPPAGPKPRREEHADRTSAVLSYRVSGRAGGVVTFAPYRPIRNREAAITESHLSMTAIDITLT
jgi:hypothetical protein